MEQKPKIPGADDQSPKNPEAIETKALIATPQELLSPESLERQEEIVRKVAEKYIPAIEWAIVDQYQKILKEFEKYKKGGGRQPSHEEYRPVLEDQDIPKEVYNQLEKMLKERGWIAHQFVVLGDNDRRAALKELKRRAKLGSDLEDVIRAFGIGAGKERISLCVSFDFLLQRLEKEI